MALISAQKTLDRFMDMPVDVLYQVFQWLDASEGLKLSQHVPRIQYFLASADATALWIRWLRNADAPECPPGMDFLHWADLLFGALVCEGCGAVDTLPDALLLRRLCADCRQAPHNLVISREQTEKQNRVSLRDTVLYRTEKHYLGNANVTVRIYWKSDWNEVKSRLDDLDRRIGAGDCSGIVERRRYINTRLSLLKSVSEIQGSLTCWISKLGHAVAARQRVKKQAVTKIVKSRCLQAGHDPRDIQRAISQVCGPTLEYSQLSDTAWPALQTKLEKSIATLKKLRLERARQDVILARKSVLAHLYQDIARTFPPSQWAFIPAPDFLMQVALFKELINEPSDQPLILDSPTLSHLNLASRIRTEITNWGLRRRQRLLKLIPHSQLDHLGVAHEFIHSDPNAHNLLDLATTVFVRFGGGAACGDLPVYAPPLISWDAVCPILVKDGDDLIRRIKYSPEGSMAVHTIISLISSLDPKTTLTSHLDEMNRRFVCMDCQPRVIEDVIGRPAMTWRECVDHLLGAVNDTTDHDHGCTSGRPRVVLLSESDTAEVILREGAGDPARSTLWTCNHCAAFYPEFVEKDVVREHLRTEHDILTAQVGVDVIVRYVGERPKESAVVFPSSCVPVPYEA